MVCCVRIISWALKLLPYRTFRVYVSNYHKTKLLGAFVDLVSTVDDTKPASHNMYYTAIIPAVWYIRSCRICTISRRIPGEVWLDIWLFLEIRGRFRGCACKGNSM